MTKAKEDAKGDQRVVNAFHRVFVGEEWAIVREHLEERLLINQPMAGFDQHFRIDPFRVVFVEGSRALLCHIDNMLKRRVIGDANIEEPAVKIVK